jgi:hypothetical protein
MERWLATAVAARQEATAGDLPPVLSGLFGGAASPH